MLKWNPQEVFQLIELYRAKEVLWNRENFDYFNRKVKLNAWNELAQEMKCPMDEVKKKIENMCGQLRRERSKAKKKCNRRGSNGEYISSWYAYEPLSFLLNRKKPYKNYNTKEHDAEPQNTTAEDDDSSKDEDEVLQSLQEEQEDNESEAEELELKNEINENESLNPLHLPTNNENDHRTSIIYSEELPKKQKMNSDTQYKRRSSTFQSLPSPSTSASAGVASNSDDSQLYANFIASKLRKYSQHTKNVLQHEISNLLFRADTGQFDLYKNRSNY